MRVVERVRVRRGIRDGEGGDTCLGADVDGEEEGVETDKEGGERILGWRYIHSVR